MIEFVQATALTIKLVDTIAKTSNNEYRRKEKERRDKMTRDERLDEDLRKFCLRMSRS
jgi:hypothetical protein